MFSQTYVHVESFTHVCVFWSKDDEWGTSANPVLFLMKCKTFTRAECCGRSGCGLLRKDVREVPLGQEEPYPDRKYWQTSIEIITAVCNVLNIVCLFSELSWDFNKFHRVQEIFLISWWGWAVDSEVEVAPIDSHATGVLNLNIRVWPERCWLS